MKLSTSQLFWLLTTMEIGMTALLTISDTFKESGQAAWMSVILAVLSSLVVTYISLKLCILFPGQTFAEFAPVIIGKWFGNLLLILYLAVWYSVGGIILREYSDFVHMALFSKTPVWVVMVMMIAVMLFAGWHTNIRALQRDYRSIYSWNHHVNYRFFGKRLPPITAVSTPTYARS
ncbi:GerAB/ArcD/ProY family transporter [Paenibacillus sp. R14(2021)]|uniref:GerAB/ArcD/ProY family transporter n=1 Tax=Paenibacillus sp. R14(2021) TaxID=2859228 RepID=UPI001C612B03|nr:GerAB/ArcD/ProY family transporter [Paenibacillus sp. R14(2021)]